MEKTLGGDRLGAGNKMKVDLHGYERSTHDLGNIIRTTMSAGTLVPFLKKIVLPGDTFDINLNCDVKTHPTIGPLFGSYKVQLDVFLAPIRLYQAMLHNNALGIGMNMEQVKLPQIEMNATVIDADVVADIDNSQINPSSILKYLGLSGVGMVGTEKLREFYAGFILMYWDTYKNYYANKQEEIGAVIHTPADTNIETIDDISVDGNALAQNPAVGNVDFNEFTFVEINYTATTPIAEQIIVRISPGGQATMAELLMNIVDTGTALTGTFDFNRWGNLIGINWRYQSEADPRTVEPKVATFPLTNLDDMRNAILQHPGTTAYIINSLDKAPYKWIYETTGGIPNILSSQEGLAIKTYQSDLLNNWVSTEWITGTGGINELTAISTVGDTFNIDTLIIQNKVYKMLMRIAVSGGSYDDWQDAVWSHDRYKRCETPMYMGGLIKELVFQEVVSNSSSESGEGGQPLGTLAGKGVLAKKHKGGKIVIKVDEPSMIMGIVSITPRIDNSQGNDWDVNLKTMNDLFKPALDQIGFQDSINEQRAWWSTGEGGGNWIQTSAGKQPAWLNYMTEINKCYGNFAIPTNEMFMTLNRRYEIESNQIKDLTTYIDPVKFNNIFAQTALDAQNFWVQIATDITARRKMSGKLMPNL